MFDFVSMLPVVMKYSKVREAAPVNMVAQSCSRNRKLWLRTGCVSRELTWETCSKRRGGAQQHTTKTQCGFRKLSAFINN